MEAGKGTIRCEPSDSFFLPFYSYEIQHKQRSPKEIQWYDEKGFSREVAALFPGMTLFPDLVFNLKFLLKEMCS
jgi:hypothetical protein